MSTAAMTDNAPVISRSVVLTVSSSIEETSDSCSIAFDVPSPLKDTFDYKPGQFLTIQIPSERTGSVARCYSLASSPHVDDALKIVVKRTRDGYGSNWLCDNIKAGDTLTVLPPSGTFTPASFSPDLLLFGAGSGITPVISILKSALAQGSAKIVLVYANRNEHSVIFAEELRMLAAEFPTRLTVIHLLESMQGLPTADQLATLSAPFLDHEVFMCGPGPFMDTVHKALRAADMPRIQVHAEVFTSLRGDPFADHVPTQVSQTEAMDAATVQVELNGETHHLRWPRRQTLVDILLDEGIDVPYSCKEGECGSCACTVREGKVEMQNSAILDPDDVADGYILGCQARPISDHLTIEF